MSAYTSTSVNSVVTDSYSYYYEDDYFTDTPLSEESNSVNLHTLIWPAAFTFTVLVANAISLAAFCVEKRLHTYNNLFIINLTVADFLTGITLMATTAHTYLNYFPFSQLFCKIYDGIRNALFTVSNIAVVVICIDRHRATYDPINHFMSRNTRKATLISTIPWLVSFSFWIPYATIWDIVIGTNTGNHCILWYIRSANAYMIANLITFFIPFIFIANLNFAILFKIFKTVGGKQVQRKFNEQDTHSKLDNGPSFVTDGTSVEGNPAVVNDIVENSRRLSVEVDDSPDKSKGHQLGSKPKAESKERRQETGAEMRKATRTLVFIVIVFVVTWFPHSLISLLYALHPPLIVPGLPRPYRLFFRWLSYANSLFNPMSYVISQPLFRTTVARLLTGHYWRRR